MLKSHVFDHDRTEWQQRWWNFPNTETFDALKTEIEVRKKAEKPTPYDA